MKNKKSNNLGVFIFLLFLGFLFSVFAVVLCKYSLNFSNPFPIILSIRSGCEIEHIDFSSMQTLYFSFFLGIIGIYFTVLSILLNARPELSIGNYFFYVKNNLLLFLSVFTFLIALLNLIIPYLSIERKVGFNFQVFSIFELIFFIPFLFRTLFYMENKKLCAKLYKKIVSAKEANIDSDISLKFYFDFVYPSFLENSFSVFDSMHELQEKRVIPDYLDCNVLNILLSDFEFKSNYVVLKQALKKIGGYITAYSGSINFGTGITLKRNNLVTYIEKYELLYFKLYEQLFFCNQVEYPYILEAVGFIKDFLTDGKNKVNNKILFSNFFNIYKSILINSKRMVVFSMFKCDSVNIHSHIHDFMILSQSLEMNYCEENLELLEMHEKFLIDIFTHIINLVQMQRIDKNNLIFVYRGLEHIKKIDLFYIDFEPYFEILPSIAWHNIKYSRNYYISILLVLCKNKNEEFYNETLNKIIYKNNGTSDLNTVYNILKENIELITEDDLSLFFSTDEILKSLKFVKNDIDSKVRNIKTVEIESLKNIDVSSELSTAIEKLKNELKISLRQLLKEESDGIENDSFYFPFKFDFNVKLLSEHFFETYTFDFLKETLWKVICSHFIKNTEKIKISSIREISNLENENKIFVSPNCFDSLIADKKFQFNGSQINFDNKKIETIYINENNKYIIPFSEIKKKIFLTDIIDFQNKSEKNIENGNVIITVTFHLVIKETEEKSKVYILN
ncbi:hypothetical protein [Treponema succinifaciens]|uniref:Uncharacterized protein n=1 Tax=Treponema succinifaciens (strain ATCC 33096 / DSM 2489 / 6091) TaxID=869209 RepID=F2NRP3_TRES6|nr:hypothetical protein [Treponema succinifaciens]AEB13861.1 hypothetical protein Tresu_0941 [Treponema succinifaciens DSM 2489]